MRGESCPKCSICDVDQAPVVHIVYIYTIPESKGGILTN